MVILNIDATKLQTQNIKSQLTVSENYVQTESIK